MKKLLVILFLIIAVPSIIFIVDDKFRKDYENPFWVGKAFSFCYMNKDAKRMKNWSDEKIYQKIDELQYSIPLISDDYSDFYWRNFELGRSVGSGFVNSVLKEIKIILRS
jgi:hypothetical protein